MTNDHPLSKVSDVVGAQVRRWREWRKWSVDELAARCAAIGATHLTTAALYALESGRKEKTTNRRRRLVSSDELLVLAHALEVNPDLLLVPQELADDAPYSITPTFTTTAGAAREWLRGAGPLASWAAIGPGGSSVVLGQDSNSFESLVRRLQEERPDELLELLRKVATRLNYADDTKGGEDAGDQANRAE